jgi:tetratricopeptide (TPR) repeat protein
LSIPEPNISAEVVQRLEHYLAVTSESIGEIAFGGPCEAASADGKLFWLLCAHRKVIAAPPHDDFSYLHLAKAFIANDRIQDAIAVYRELMKNNPGFMGYYDCPLFNIGILEADNGSYEEAIASLTKCFRRFPDESHILHYYLGTVYHEMGKFDDADRYYSSALERMGALNVFPSKRRQLEAFIEEVRNGIQRKHQRLSYWMEPFE